MVNLVGSLKSSMTSSKLLSLGMHPSRRRECRLCILSDWSAFGLLDDWKPTGSSCILGGNDEMDYKFTF